MVGHHFVSEKKKALRRYLAVVSRCLLVVVSLALLTVALLSRNSPIG